MILNLLKRRWSQALSIAVAMLLLTEIAFRLVPGLAGLDARLDDHLLVNVAPRTQASAPEVAIVTITEPTLAGLPYRSPIDRGFLANLLNGLARIGVRSVTFDMLFDQATEPEKDARLVQAIRDFPGPVVIAWADGRAGLIEQQQAWLQQFIQVSGAQPGFANMTVDSDGLIRRYDTRLPGTEVRSLAAATLLANGREISPEAESGLIGWRISADQASQPFPTLAAHGVQAIARIRPEALKPALANRMVLIGADLPQQDRHRTSLSASTNPAIQPLTAGVEIHTHIIDQLAEGQQVPVLHRDAALAIIVLMALLGALLGGSDTGLWLKFAGLAGSLTAYALAVWYAADAHLPLLPTARPVAVLLMSFAATTTLSVYFSRRDTRFIRDAFSQYLAPALVEQLAQHPDSLKLGGERREMSFLFSDIAGFTSLSERLPPERLTSLLNGYLDGMSEIALRHGGTIDKFIGDAVVVLFGAPTPMADHALRALQCAVDMDAFCETYRQQNADVELGLTRIGIHSGEAIVGNFGGRQRFDYTAMGDSMNIAARLEAANKHFHTRVAISGEVLQRAYPAQPDGLYLDCLPQAEILPVGKVILKGKKIPVAIHTVRTVGPAETGAAYLSAWQRLDSDTAAARNDLASLQTLDPDNGLIGMHLDRLAQGESGTTFELREK